MVHATALLLRAIRIVIGLYFAATLSSPESFCVLFAIPSEQTVELKWLMLTHTKDDSCGISLVKHVCVLFFGVNVFDVDFRVQSNNQ